ncbi:MAG: helix-turn-helix transcriptional regulator [Pirellulales bacterium]|nr:helix-turn-helix transcriptional regulator [Pirellulales bacterium]
MRAINQSTNLANAMPGRRAMNALNGSSFAEFCGYNAKRRLNGRGITTMKSAPLPDELLLLVAEKFRMLSDSTRLAILRCLMDGKESNVSEIVARTGRELANVSKHLKMLAEARLISRRKEGSFVLYKLDDPVLQKICSLVCDSLRRDLEAEVKRNKRILKTGG